MVEVVDVVLILIFVVEEEVVVAIMVVDPTKMEEMEMVTVIS